jgi:ornithine carbamoyltransferase
MDLIALDDVEAHDVEAIFSLALAPDPAAPLEGTVAWSFEGRGIRTRASFLQAFSELGLPSSRMRT